MLSVAILEKFPGEVQAQDESSIGPAEFISVRPQVIAPAPFIIVDKCSLKNAYDSLAVFYSLCYSFRIKEGTDANARDENNNTPLHYAASWGDEKAVVDLIENGATVNARNDFGETPFDLALKQDYFDIAHLLEEGFLDKTRIWLDEAF